MAFTDPAYPSLLGRLTDAPAVLWVRGHAAVLGATAVAIVGSRAATAGGLHAGRRLATVGEPGEFYDDGRPTLSPDGSRAAISILNEQGISSIWIVNTATGVRSRFTLDGTDHGSGVWSPDGSRLAFDAEVGDEGGSSPRRPTDRAWRRSGPGARSVP